MISSVFSIRHVSIVYFITESSVCKTFFFIFIHFEQLIAHTKKNREKLAFHVFFLAIQELLW